MSASINTIEKIMDEKIRPMLLQHEGNVEIVSYEENILKIRLTGQCSGCPSAQLTTEDFIETNLMNAIPEIKKVLLINEVSPELIDFAKKFLNHQIEH